MSNPRPVKFNFDTVFAAKGATQAAAPRARSSYSAAEVETIRKESFAHGKADTEAQAAALRATALATTGQRLAAVLGALDTAVRTLRQESVTLALTVARNLAASTLSTFPEREVEALIGDCLHKMHREPRLIVRASPVCAEALQAEIDALCHRHGYAGRVVIAAEPTLTGADCRIEWEDGGVERDFSHAFATIEECVNRWRTMQSNEGS